MSVGVDFGTGKNLNTITLLLAQPSVCIKMDVYVDTQYVGVIEQSETCDWTREDAKPGSLVLDEAPEGVHVITLHCVSGGNLYQIAFSAPAVSVAPWHWAPRS